jgi:transposase
MKNTEKKKGRPPVIPQEFYRHDFKAAAKTEKIARYRVKFLALEQIRQGAGYREVAAIFNVHETMVKKWVNWVVAYGLKGVYDEPGRGRKPQLPATKLSDFKNAVIELQKKRPGGRINAKDIVEMTNQKFGTNYKMKSIYDVLHKADLVWISSRSIHPAHNAEAQEAFKKTF